MLSTLLARGMRGRVGQCANCLKVEDKNNNVILRTCASCKEEKYCSRDCQAAAWPLHKQWCSVTGMRTASHADYGKALWTWGEKNRGSLTSAALLALEVKRDISRSRHFVVVFTVEPKEGNHRPEAAFRIVNTATLPLRGGPLPSVITTPVERFLDDIRARRDAGTCECGANLSQHPEHIPAAMAYIIQMADWSKGPPQCFPTKFCEWGARLIEARAGSWDTILRKIDRGRG